MSDDANKEPKEENFFKLLEGMEGKFEFGNCTGAGGFGNCTIILTPKGSREKHVIKFDMDKLKAEALIK